jgi:hypothetical protein
MESIRTFLGVEAAAFGLAALVHTGMLLGGYQHREAAIAESVIAAVLVLGLIASVLRPRLSRLAGLGAQGFALLGTLVGLFTIAVGVGPQSRFDVVLHLGFVTVLIAGLVVSARRTAGTPV